MSRGQTTRAPRAAAASSTSSRVPWIDIALVVLGGVVYFQTRHFQFVDYDDPRYVTENPVVRGGLNWHSLWQAFTTLTSPYWHPVTWITHLADVSMFGLDPGPPHLVNAALHVAATLLLFRLLRRMTGQQGPSAVAAAIFAVHPVHAESVAWITERKDVLSSVLLLVSFGAYLRYVERPSRVRYGLLACAFALALMAKPMVVTFPVLLLLLDYWPLARVATGRAASMPWRTAIAEKAPLAAMAVVIGLLTIRLQNVAGALPNLQTMSLGARAANAAVSYVAYLRELVWPVGLAAFYPQHPISLGEVLGAGVVLAGISWAALRWRRTRPYILVGWCWFVVMLAPVIGVQAGEQSRADRHLYLAMVGVVVIVVWGARDLLARIAAPAVTATLASCGAVALLLPVGIQQTATWRDSLTLWHHAADVTTGNYKAYEKLGEAERDLGEYEAAAADYRRALAAAAPNSSAYDAVLRNDLGLVAVRAGRPEEAVTEFQTALALDPTFAAAAVNLGNALATIGRLPEAAERFAEAIRADPKAAEAHVGLGNVLLQQGRADDAIRSFRAAIALAPEQPDALNGLGAALTETGHPADAIPELTNAIRIRQQFPSAEVNLAIALLKMGRTDEARRHAEAALAIAPGLPSARQVIASLPIK